MNEEPEWEPQLLEGLIQGNTPQFVCEMIDTVIAYVPGKLSEAQEGLLAGELGTVCAVFHALKSTAGIIGAMSLKALAKEIELYAREKKGELIPALFGEFQKAYVRVEKALQEKRRELGGEAKASA